MKLWSVLAGTVLLAGCQGGPVQLPVVHKPLPAPEKVVELPRQAPEPVKPVLAISDDAATLQAWVNYRASMLNRINEERELLNADTVQDDVWQLKRTILQLHPDTPYLSRLRVQMQLAEQLATLPAPLAALLSWDLAFNQKLLESESAVKALGRLNGQQQDNLDKLQKQNADLQKKIEALTQIEAKLNQSGGG